MDGTEHPNRREDGRLEDLVAELRLRMSQVSLSGGNCQSAPFQNAAVLEEGRQTLDLWASQAVSLQRCSEQAATTLAQITSTLERLTAFAEANQAAQLALLDRLSALEGRVAARAAATAAPTEKTQRRQNVGKAWGALATTGMAAAFMLLVFWFHSTQDAVRPMLDRIFATL